VLGVFGRVWVNLVNLLAMICRGLKA